MNDSLGDRMKTYEQAWRQILPPRLPIVVRVDGRAFHTLTKKAKKPFDPGLTAVMDYVTEQLADNMQGCVLAYTQSDEISLVLQQDATLTTQPYFGGVVQKIASVTASMATAEFNYRGDLWHTNQLGMFDARVWCMPWNEVANYFLWRAKDCRRNSINMVGRSVFSHKEMTGKSTDEVLNMLDEMLDEEEASWHAERDRNKYGYWYVPGASESVLPHLTALSAGDIHWKNINLLLEAI